MISLQRKEGSFFPTCFIIRPFRKVYATIAILGGLAICYLFLLNNYAWEESEAENGYQPEFVVREDDSHIVEENEPSIPEDVETSKTNTDYIKIKDLDDPFRLSGCQPYMNLMSTTPPPLLENFKNPCWREEFPSTNLYTKTGLMPTPLIKNYELFKENKQKGRLWQLRCLPYFYIAGFQKCASRALFFNIRNHPMVPHNNKKGNQWWPEFRNQCNYSVKGTAVPIRNYADVFDTPARELERYKVDSKKWSNGYHPMIIGDATGRVISTEVNWWNLPENKGKKLYKDVPKYINAHYIKHVTPDARFIISMRNPADRLYSYYKMVCKRRAIPSVFHDYVVTEIEHAKKLIEEMSLPVYVSIPRWKLPSEIRHKCLVFGESLYYPHLVEWLKVFPRKQLHFIKMEELSQDRVTALDNVYEFLGLEPVAKKVINPKIKNIRVGNCSTCRVQSMLAETRKLLEDFFRPYNKMTADLLEDSRWAFE